MEKPKFRGHLKLLVLKLLEEGPLHGYGVMAELEKRYGMPQPSPGAIYPILASLKRSGLIEVAGEGKREKKLYRITEKGREYLKEHEYEVNEAIETAERFREFARLGGRELAEVLKETFNSINELGEEQRRALAKEFAEFTKRVRLILLGEIKEGTE
ncbi:transcription regulator, PadR-like family [Thermococcus kodakarensis KOD1]|uniref:Transcription regulator, PadR-like family n=1 Tax=Thermococcus kodakarensis (strain ATCC BAA-918 / JCM 12380 / KOD1) TaxID=69014 RepID=Q5JE72_THEKO|nr:PadR family transcriptional regulator [Thermococcus kodakarensis]WCN29287.1 PadR family transcriptional regulator [Thermococcus kodakarensis]WCN31584.1 PadR family transcriptional regulator [Thermococcus kodakarensis]BAD85332.1 transcription regulator, PadR-like family [Thermococcus kodakarensis KOD1]